MATKKTTIKPRKAEKFKGGIFTALLQFIGNEKMTEKAIYFMAAVFGTFVPTLAYVSKYHVNYTPKGFMLGAITLACLAFSIPTMVQFGTVAFNKAKGIGFALALELAMLFAPHTALQVSALIILCAVNTIAVFYNLRTGKQFSNLVKENI